jgi:hypothetical protein
MGSCGLNKLYIIIIIIIIIIIMVLLLSSFLGSTAPLWPCPPPQDPIEFFGGFSTIIFFTG